MYSYDTQNREFCQVHSGDDNLPGQRQGGVLFPWRESLITAQGQPALEDLRLRVLQWPISRRALEESEAMPNRVTHPTPQAEVNAIAQ